MHRAETNRGQEASSKRGRGVCVAGAGTLAAVVFLGLLAWAVLPPAVGQLDSLQHIVAMGGSAKAVVPVPIGPRTRNFLIDRDTWGNWRYATPLAVLFLPIRSVTLWPQCDEHNIGALRGFRSLQSLTIFRSLFSRKEMKIIGSIRSLRVLVLRGKVAGGGISYLEGCRSLRQLTLIDMKVDDRDVADLTALAHIHRLGLPFTGIGNGIFAVLARFPRLTQLSLAGDNITDSGLRQLCQLSDIRRLDISRTAATDSGLMELKRMPHLSTLFLAGTRCTGTGIKKLMRARPTLRVDASTFSSF